MKLSLKLLFCVFILIFYWIVDAHIKMFLYEGDGKFKASRGISLSPYYTVRMSELNISEAQNVTYSLKNLPNSKYPYRFSLVIFSNEILSDEVRDSWGICSFILKNNNQIIFEEKYKFSDLGNGISSGNTFYEVSNSFYLPIESYYNELLDSNKYEELKFQFKCTGFKTKTPIIGYFEFRSGY